jgi:transposase
MSLPDFSTQAELFSTAGLSGSLFAPTDRYRLFAKLVYPHLVAARPTLATCYCAENGRVAIEPVVLLGISILQDLDGVPDRQAVEMLRYHAGWSFALNRQLGDAVFHPTTLVNFRNRLEEHQQSALGFTTILAALEEAGWVSRQSRQRLDSTQMFGRVARMSRLDCVRESLRLALQELEGATQSEARPLCWAGLWERYVESQADYRAGAETLARKLVEAGADAWQLLQWLRSPGQTDLAAGTQAQLLARVFGEQFEVLAGQPALLSKEKEVVTVEGTSVSSQADPSVATAPDEPAPPLEPSEPLPSEGVAERSAVSANAPELGATVLAAAGATLVEVVPREKGQMTSQRVQNPHDPEATYSVKGQGQQKKEHVGYKVQVAESVCEATLAAGEPTRNFITGIVTHPAYQSDEAGAVQMEAEQAQMGLEKPPVQYVDGAYISAQQLAQAQAEGRELIGPAPSAPQKEGRFSMEHFQINVEERKAICPAGKASTQCSRLEEAATGKVSYRFEFGAQCHDCPLRGQCLGKDQRHRTVLVGEHHTFLQARRQEQQTHAFKQRMKHRNGIEGTQSELVRGHGLRHARYRGLAKVKLQNYFSGAACNVKRWLRQAAWKIQQAVSTATTTMAVVAD